MARCDRQRFPGVRYAHTGGADGLVESTQGLPASPYDSGEFAGGPKFNRAPREASRETCFQPDEASTGRQRSTMAKASATAGAMGIVRRCGALPGKCTRLAAMGNVRRSCHGNFTRLAQLRQMSGAPGPKSLAVGFSGMRRCWRHRQRAEAAAVRSPWHAEMSPDQRQASSAARSPWLSASDAAG